jgi:hypothetical protein
MRHSLLNPKLALDAVNEQLNDPASSDDPRADKDYNFPFGSKGTEADDMHYGSHEDAAAPQEEGSAWEAKLRQACKLLFEVKNECPDTDISSCADMSAQDLLYFLDDQYHNKAKVGSAPSLVQLALASVSHIKQAMRRNPDPTIAGLLDAHCRRVVRTATAERRKQAEVEMHKSPDMLPPRQDMRTHLDPEVKAETDAEVHDPEIKRGAVAKNRKAGSRT